MKKIAILLFLGAFAWTAGAQHDTRAEVMADIEKAGGTYYMYPTNQPVPTAAPKGYQPYYITHFGRHGARYALGSNVYTEQMELWSKAHDKGWLTPAGERIYSGLKALYPQVKGREGQLTFKGQEQHRFIARQMYRNYPAVFKGKTRAIAASTDVHRVIVSMYSCLDQLKDLDGDFIYTADYGEPYESTFLPEELLASTQYTDTVNAQTNRLRASVLAANIPGRWFTVPADSLSDSPFGLLSDMHTIVSDLDNLDIPAPEALQDIFTPEERYGIWEASNFRHYARFGRSPYMEQQKYKTMIPLLEEFVAQAESDRKEGIALRLRFGHDTCLMPLLSLLGVNGMDREIANLHEVAAHWRNFDIPMACNLQLVFFKSKKHPDILVQVLLNGFEASLPLEMVAPGSFYRWEDVKSLITAQERG